MAEDLIRVCDLKEALSAKDSDSIFFAGGTGIEYKDSGIRAKKLIAIGQLDELKGIRDEDGCLRIGSLVTFTQALTDEKVPEYFKEALRFCGSLQKRNMATIGGNVASWRSDSYLIPTLAAAGAMVELEDRTGHMCLDIREYGEKRDTLKDALITAVLLRAQTSPGEDPFCAGSSARMKVLSKRYANTVESHAYLTIAMGREGDEWRIASAVKGCGILFPDVLNWSLCWDKADVKDDLYGSCAYKRYLTGVTLDGMYEKLSAEGGEES